MPNRAPLSAEEVLRLSRTRKKIKAVVARRDDRARRERPSAESILVGRTGDRSKLPENTGGSVEGRILTFKDIIQIIREDLYMPSLTISDDDLKLLFRTLLDSSRYQRPPPSVDKSGKMRRPPQAILVEEFVRFITREGLELKVVDRNNELVKSLRVRRIVKLAIQQYLKRTQLQGFEAGLREDDLTEERQLGDLFRKYDKEKRGDLSMVGFTRIIRKELQISNWDVNAERLQQMFQALEAGDEDVCTSPSKTVREELARRSTGIYDCEMVRSEIVDPLLNPSEVGSQAFEKKLNKKSSARQHPFEGAHDGSVELGLDPDRESEDPDERLVKIGVDVDVTRLKRSMSCGGYM
ncbi:hypothetical protein Pmar_PMAR016119 [Perkinsus marinus ATCC 50983]|uniref:EF-hand domain-containing protein n=1 Tax=Perkinsus marinus (strain ATCC 50983 / TXsc) TaxID=423536 RepID=C5LZ32_PERM5|nr:hypothetical protein Pmar_PMAR016119 [Perkinsus marinus ATCC 50983]EEQ98041.1 hypothetical protein Pmar_PMAR016119 [Perkinsus marinus ATCC 50983]|eukprot:XP_002765324.1 hypothetical protein Pmar_PMAR016119 [Perkinsus marinus ATCC 50983]